MRFFIFFIIILLFAPIITETSFAAEPQVSVLSIGFVEYSADPWFTGDETDINKQWALPKAGFLEAWQKTLGNSNVVVAVVDTGIDSTHEDLSHAHFVEGYDAFTKQTIAPGSSSDENGHGTLVAGIIAAVKGNSLGIAGAAPEVSLMPVRALDKTGNGTSIEVSLGITWAADHGASVINLSLGGLGFAHDTRLSGAIEYAYRKGSVIVAAAGNDAAVTGGSLDADPVFPICHDNGENMVLGVSAVDFQGLKPGFANFGKACVDVLAPGKRIVSTINRDPVSGGVAPNAYAYASGTSMAVPFVSAQAALLKSLYPASSPRQVMDRIISTASSVDQLNLSQCAGFSCAGFLGAGMINVKTSLNQPILKVVEGDLVVDPTGRILAIVGGRSHPVFDFVGKQRFSGVIPKTVAREDLAAYPEGSPLEPLDGTLIKSQDSAAVFYIYNGVKLPISYQVFLQRGFRFEQIMELHQSIVESWITGSFLAPLDGTLVKAGKSRTVYWTVSGSLHPISFRFWKDRGLNIFPIMYISDHDLRGLPLGEAFF